MNFLPIPGVFPPYLYIDPSAVTVAVSSISGIVIAVGAAVAIWWTKAKKKAAEKLHIDANAHKEVEADLVVNDLGEASEENPTVEASTSGTPVPEDQKKDTVTK